MALAPREGEYHRILGTLCGQAVRDLMSGMKWGRCAQEEIDKAVARGVPPLGIGPDCVVEQAIVDKNARVGRGVRLLNEAGLGEKDGEGYFIRDGIVIVPKDAAIPDGTVV